MTDDRALLAAWRGGDQAAGNRLFGRHFEPIGRFFYAKVTTGVDDLVQRTFLGLLERADALPPETDVRAYLFGIARRLLLRRFRDRYRGKEFDALETSVIDVDDSPSQITDRRQQLGLLLRGLQSIAIDHQILLELFYWEELPAPAIAEILEIPEGTVRSRLRRARELLAAAVAAQPGDPALVRETVDALEVWARALRDRIGR
ncbi:MAG: sigma-70 family RNA polymerase sigma factor [Nannocystaceae bacterium]